eukprot:Ihof_evm5s328 gene=Ihof_evmTU5s328
MDNSPSLPITSPFNLHHDAFKALCTQLYFESNPIAQYILHAVETASTKDDVIILSLADVPTEMFSVTDLLKVLESIGVGVDHSLPLGTVQVFQDIKNKVRQEFHIKERRHDDTWMKEQLTIFINTYKKNFAAHPFLMGLRVIFLSQKNSKHVKVWRISDATLTQSGCDFMHDAVGLLCNALRFTCDHSRPSPGERDYKMCNNWLDKQLTALAALLPKDSDLIGRPTGTIVDTLHERLLDDTDLNA